MYYNLVADMADRSEEGLNSWTQKKYITNHRRNLSVIKHKLINQRRINVTNSVKLYIDSSNNSIIIDLIEGF